MKYVFVLLCMLLPTLVMAECDDDKLFTELNTDPSVPKLDYATAYGKPITKNSEGSDNAILNTMNLVRSGTAFEIQKTLMYAYEVAALMDRAEFLALNDIKQQQLQSLFAPLQIDVSSQNIRDILFNAANAIFPNPGATRTNLITAVKRQGSRAEILCGSNRTLSQISSAIRGTK